MLRTFIGLLLILFWIILSWCRETNFDLIDDDLLAKIQDDINNRPLRLLNWTTPSQAQVFV